MLLSLSSRRPRIFTRSSRAYDGAFDAAKEAVMELDPSGVRRPNPRFGWGWVDRRIILQADAYLAPMSQVEVVVYLFLCLAADRHGISWYGPAALSRLVKRSPDEIRKAMTDLAARHLIALAGRLVQVVDVDAMEAWRASRAAKAVPETLPPHVASPSEGAAPAREELARLPEQQREELLRQARKRMARILGTQEPTTSALEAVAVGLTRERSR